MDLSKVELALDNIDIGLKKYLTIMEIFHKVDVSKDRDFQKKYNGFYRMRQRKQEFYNEYFTFMENSKSKDITFGEVLNHFYEKFNRVEASFSSKLVATINPNLPVWDEHVLKNLNIKKPSYSCKDRINKTIQIYSEICKWYNRYLSTSESKILLDLFNKRYPNINITDVKKLDLILWQMR
ncbi:MAG: hypothetical protein PWQ37_2487 [Candidatus Petromonas sp.]|nr:hypothetical protein [Candidatus Petromonas sp.]